MKKYSRCCHLTLSSAISNFSKATSLTKPVQALLLYQLQDLRLDFLSQLPGSQILKSKQKMEIMARIEGNCFR